LRPLQQEKSAHIITMRHGSRRTEPQMIHTKRLRELGRERSRQSLGHCWSNDYVSGRN